MIPPCTIGLSRCTCLFMAPSAAYGLATCYPPSSCFVVCPMTSLVVFALQEDVNSDEWQQSYNSAEDFLLWQHQSQLQELTIRGSANLGGCLTQADLAAQLPARLPALRCIRLQECPDMQPVQLQGLVRVRAAPLIMVQGCGICVTAQRCAQFSHESRGAVAVEYCS